MDTVAVVNAEDGEDNADFCRDNASETSEVDVINWDQLEQEVYSGRNNDGDKRQSRLLNTLNLREEIRRQLAEDDAKKSSNGGELRKSKSGFLDDSSSSESDEEAEADEAEAEESSSSTTGGDDEDREFYLNEEFSTKVCLRKVGASSTFRTLKDSNCDLNKRSQNGSRVKKASAAADQLVVRPLQARPSLKTRIQNQKDLQICFLNDFPTRTSTPSVSGRSSTESTDRFITATASPSDALPGLPSLLSKEFWSPPAENTTARHRVFQSFYMPKSRSMFEMETEKQRTDKTVMGHFEQAQAQWRHEMQLKIQRSHQQIHLQIQRQRKRHKKSPITTKIYLPHGRTRLDRHFLIDMPTAHLQIILNDLLEQIENLNDGLVRFLEERDELHMEQDSKLVDIDDLSRRLKDQWIVNWKRRNLPQKEGMTSCLEDSDALIRAYKERNKPTIAGRNKFSPHPEHPEDSSPEPAVVTPTSQSNSLTSFRQRIRSLLS